MNASASLAMLSELFLRLRRALISDSTPAPAAVQRTVHPHEKVLFLDFDGVLHRHTTGTFRQLPLLESWLVARPDVLVVISSNWRSSASLEELRQWFRPELVSRVIDVIPVLGPEGHGVRQQEIEAWLHAHPAVDWVALDDSPELFHPGCPWLVVTTSATGLDETTLSRLSDWYRGTR